VQVAIGMAALSIAILDLMLRHRAELRGVGERIIAVVSASVEAVGGWIYF